MPKVNLYPPRVRTSKYEAYREKRHCSPLKFYSGELMCPDCGNTTTRFINTIRPCFHQCELCGFLDDEINWSENRAGRHQTTNLKSILERVSKMNKDTW